MTDPDRYESDLIDLTGVSLAQLRTEKIPGLRRAVTELLEQTGRPRNNLGSSGPPGRVD